MKKRELEALIKGIAGPIIKKLARDSINPVKAQLAEATTELAALKAKPVMKFCGTWQRGKTYEAGDAVVRDGHLWVCKAQTAGEPSKDFVGWQDAVRQGSIR